MQQGGGRVTIYANGMGGGIGRVLWPELAKLGALRIATTSQDGALHCDLRSPRDTDGEWFEKDDVFIFPAAWSKPDQCKSDPEGAWHVNVESTSLLIEKALSRGAAVIFFSSDTAYGRQNGALSEAAPLLATEEYGKMKAEVEHRFASTEGFTALRLSYVVSREDGVTSYLASCAHAGAAAELFSGYARNMVWIDDVVAVVLALTAKAQHGARLPKAVNVGGPACISRAQMAEAYRSGFAPSLRYVEVPAPAGFFDARPRRIELDVARLVSLLGRAPIPLELAYKKVSKG